MSILADLKMYGRFAWGLNGFLRHTITLEEAKAIVRQRLAERETNFLRLVEKGIYGYPRSPYLPMLKLAQVESGDIQNMVRAKGLEDTLRGLREAGVYVTFEEYKGRKPIVRNGRVIPVQVHDFDNPYLKHHYYRESGGSTGAGTRVPTDLDHLAALAPNQMLAYEAHGLLGAPDATWSAILPSHTVDTILTRAYFGQHINRWFSPLPARDWRPPLRFWLATYVIIVLGRLFGAPVPWPEAVRMDQAAVIARWMAETVRIHGACLLRTMVSRAVRVGLAAQAEGLDLTGATMWGGGEPPTPAKVQAITACGARWVASYYFAETGIVGLGCANPADVNDNHFFKDCLALIQHPRRVPGSEITVDAFYFTSLLSSNPKLLLNVESDDYGVVETRSCGCLLESCGFTEHLRHVRSFRKLTGEGVTLVGSEMLHILEEVLPARFGGSLLDYQLLEEEDKDGLTRLSLLISPQIEIDDEEEVIESVLEALRHSSAAADIAQAIWSQAGTLQVKRMEPILTARGKLFPLHLAQRTGHPTDATTGSAFPP